MHKPEHEHCVFDDLPRDSNAHQATPFTPFGTNTTVAGQGSERFPTGAGIVSHPFDLLISK